MSRCARGGTSTIAHLAFLCATVAGILFAPVRAHDLDGFVQETMKRWAVPGVAVAVVQDGKLIFAQGYGVQQVGRPERVDENTLFGIGSMTKSFTATAVAMLVDDGKVNWDRSAIDYIPWLRFSDPWITANVSVRDLAAHKVGIDDNFTWMHRSWDTATTLRGLQHLDASVPFRSFLYSNTGYTALGTIVESTSGRKWEDFVNDRILRVLHMDRSNTWRGAYVEEKNLALCWLCEPPPGAALGRDALKSMEHNAAAPHGLSEGSATVPPGGRREAVVWPWRYEPAIAPAGAINSTAHDMAQWLRFHLSSGVFDGNRLLTDQQMTQLHSLQVPILPGDEFSIAVFGRGGFELAGFGLGWSLGTHRGLSALKHRGGQVGFGGSMWLVPGKQLGVVVLQNFDYRQSYAHEVIAQRFVDYYAGLPADDSPAQFEKAWSAGDLQVPHTTALSVKDLGEYGGAYRNDVMGDATIKIDRGTLVLAFEERSIADLRPVGHQVFIARFRTADHAEFPVVFTFHSMGGASGFVFGGAKSTLHAFEFRRLP